MVYDLGIDVGTSYTAAAIRRVDGTVEVVGLGPIADNIPSVVYLNDDGSLIVGDAAARRAAIDPAGAAREFKRRLGDPTPLILRTSPFSAEALIAKMIDHVVARVTDRERDRPRHTVVTHPANWGPYKLELFDQAFRIANIEDHSRLPEPQAAAMAYAAEARVPTGSVVAVYDLGGGTFDAAVLRKTDGGFEALGESVGIEHLGGVDFDEAVLHHVRTAVGDRWPSDPEDPSLPAPMLHLRRACMEAKELLSSETEVQIPVLLPGVDTSVPLNRAQFEAMITPRLEDSLSALEAAIGSAGVQPGQLNAILLVGGSSRIPLVTSMLRQRFGPLVAGDIDPLYAVARGAALAAAAAAGEAAPSPSFFAGPAAPAPLGVAPAGAAPVAPAAQPGVPPIAAAPPTVVAANPAAPPAAAPVPTGMPAPAVPVGMAPPTPAAPPSPSPSAPPASSPMPVAASMPPPQMPANPPGPTLGAPLGEPEGRKGGRAKVLVPLVAVALLAAGGGAWALTRGGGGDEQAGGSGGGVASAADMVEIPAGTYTMGFPKPEPNFAETLEKPLDVAAFSIDLYEVTNEQYAAFVNQKEAAPPLGWPGGRFPDDKANHPVQGVSFAWAAAYCSSLGKRLPTEAEWEASARGPEASIYPWGETAADGGVPESGTYEKGTVTTNQSSFGVFDLTGNVWEWVSESYDARVDPSMHILRGGQNGYLRRNSVRLPVDDTSNALKIAGFRCAADTADPTVEPLQFGDFEVPEAGNEIAPTTTQPGVLFSDTFDDATSGWIEKTTDTQRFGYHPNGYFHLETKAENVDVTVESSFAAPLDKKLSVAATAFVDPANTSQDSGIFSYGVLFRSSINKDGNALIFVVDPRSQAWLVCSRNPENGKWVALEKKSRAIPDAASIEVRMIGDDNYEFLIGGQLATSLNIPGYTGTGVGMVVVSYAGSQKAHIHFDELVIRELG